MDNIGKNHLSEFLKPKEPTAPTPAPPVEDPKPAEPTPTATEPTPNTDVDPTPAEPTPTPAPVPEIETPDAIAPETPITSTTELNEEAVKNFLKEKYGKEVESIDTLFKDPEPTVDPLEGLSESAQQFLKFNKETGRDYKEFIALNRDLTNSTPLELAREKAIALSDGELSLNDVDEFLEEKLNVDLSDPKNVSKFDLINIKTFGKDYKESLLADKEKYIKPIERKEAPTDMVPLENGLQMTKESYDKAVKARDQYIEDVSKASDNIKELTFEVNIDENGTNKVMPLSYEYSKADVQNMASKAMDIDKAFTEMFSDNTGKIDQVKLQQGLYRADPTNFGKIVNAIVHKALAKQAEDFMKEEHNIPNNRSKGMPNQKGKGGNTIPIPGSSSNYGVKFNLEQFSPKS